MTITAERFAFALKNLSPVQWRPFEQLATVFLAAEFPNLRPVSDPSGDGGADALLFRAEDDPTVLVQYSLRTDVADKINETIRRLKKTFPEVRVLVYVTNQPLESRAASLTANARRTHKIHLDPRGAEWLIATRNETAATVAEAEELATLVANPILAESGQLIEAQAQALDDLEAKAAFIYLGLQWADDEREKGLTKVCFEAIVRSVLRETTSESRLSRQEIYSLVKKLLPGHNVKVLHDQVDGALARLNKKFVRHWKAIDEFCLTWDERLRLAERLMVLSAQDFVLRAYLQEALQTSASELQVEVEAEDLDHLVGMCRSIIEKVLLDRGEAFAIAVARDKGADVRSADIEAVVNTVVTKSAVKPPVPVHVIAATLQTLLVSPPEDIRIYLRGLADTYTLFAFMRETPDVQSAVVKMFSEGDIWLDTSVILPLFAEYLLEESDRSHTQMLSAAFDCGLKLHVTDGVIEEVASHIYRCRMYLRAIQREGAHGEPPFLLSAHRFAGLSDADFPRWLETFCGTVNPDVDLMEFLEEEQHVFHSPLTDFANKASVEMRAAVAEVWHENRDYRERMRARLGIPVTDPATRARLIDHDVENYLGIVMRRDIRREKRSAFGYKSWWLTLDRTAFKVKDKIAHVIDGRPIASPAISPDFMLNYLVIGPVRKRLTRKDSEALPLMLNMRILDAVPPDLLELAEELRSVLIDLPHRVVKRKIRETLEDARHLLGPKGQAGEVGLTEEIKKKLIDLAKRR